MVSVFGWILFAALSGVWPAVVLAGVGLLAWGVFPVALYEGWADQPRKRPLWVIMGLVLLVLLLRFGGEWMLHLFALTWRRWVRSILELVGIALLTGMGVWTGARLLRQAGQPAARRAAAGVWLLVLVGSALLYGWVRLTFTYWDDRVTVWEGRTVVSEDTGIFEETFYAYAGPFARGREVLFVWKD